MKKLSLTRRHLLSNSIWLALASGCGPSLREAYVTRDFDDLGYSGCEPPISDDLIIDAHCHLINQKDGSARELVANRVLNLDETGLPGIDWMVGTFAQIVAGILGIATSSAEVENRQVSPELVRSLNDMMNPPARASGAALCEYADREQAGIIRAGEKQQITGFFSNRLRNAAQLMLVYPQVDLFLPSMVDFYEGFTKINYVDQITFYSNLALITRGRFLPLVSFSPEREYDDRNKYGRGPDDSDAKKSQFWWLKRAINHLGFVGVKVHPSTGFSPIDNLAFGCSNRSRRYETKPDRELYDRFVAYDEYMAELLDYCKSANVPILSHGNVGLTVANETCVTGDRPSRQETLRKRPTGLIGDKKKGEWFYPFGAAHRIPTEDGNDVRLQSAKRQPEDYTASPKAWIEAMNKADERAPHLPPSRVIFGHLSGSIRSQLFSDGKRRAVPSAWLELTARLTKTNKNFYADLSEVSELFRGVNGKAYTKAFHDFLRKYRHMENQLIYGSDWHMPGTALTGREYLDSIRNILPDGPQKKQIMGERAADVFGLRPGTANMARLERFFRTAPDVWGNTRANPANPDKDPSLRPEEINWWSKVT